jgi:hypothetical protein
MGTRRQALAAAALCAAIGLWLAATLPASAALGWDESMHAALPAARIALGLRTGDLGSATDAVLGASQYPFAWPLALGLVQFLVGVSEGVARTLGCLAWAAALFATFKVVREALAQLAPKRVPGLWLGPWAALACAALSPLAAAYAGTLFLEVPSALATACALHAWTRRDGTRARELAAGAWIAVALFTKWNYGVLLVAALSVDWLLSARAAWRDGSLLDELWRASWLVLPPISACAWWFLLPLPGGIGLAAEHRASLFAYLSGNLGGAPTPIAQRALLVVTALGPSARFGLALLAAAACAVPFALRPPVRAIALSAIALAAAPLAHPFFLERFLIPALVPLAALAGIGLARMARASRPRVLSGTAAVLFLALLAPARDAAWIAGRLGLLAQDEAVRAYQLEELAKKSRLGAGRALKTGGLARDEHEALVALVASAARPGERLGWIGVSSDLSPAALHLELLRHGWSAEQFLARAHLPLDLTYFGAGERGAAAFSDTALAAFAAERDLLVWTEPPDLRERAERAFTAELRARLVARLGRPVEPLGTVELARPLRPPLAVTLFACRPTE